MGSGFFRSRRLGPGRAGTITGAQEAYLRRLLNEAFARRIETGLNLDSHHLNNLSMTYASQAISAVKERLSAVILDTDTK